jgi:5-(carboxyamino)imidazole ribonucleotide mutase
MLAAKTIVPVLGVPVPTRNLKGLDSLLSIVQMPKGVPVATFAIGEAGAANAGLFAVALLARDDERLAAKLDAFRKKQVRTVRAMKLPDVDRDKAPRNKKQP